MGHGNNPNAGDDYVPLWRRAVGGAAVGIQAGNKKTDSLTNARTIAASLLKRKPWSKDDSEDEEADTANYRPFAL